MSRETILNASKSMKLNWSQKIDLLETSTERNCHPNSIFANYKSSNSDSSADKTAIKLAKIAAEKEEQAQKVAFWTTIIPAALSIFGTVYASKASGTGSTSNPFGTGSGTGTTPDQIDTNTKANVSQSENVGTTLLDSVNTCAASGQKDWKTYENAHKAAEAQFKANEKAIDDSNKKIATLTENESKTQTQISTLTNEIDNLNGEQTTKVNTDYDESIKTINSTYETTCAKAEEQFAKTGAELNGRITGYKAQLEAARAAGQPTADIEANITSCEQQLKDAEKARDDAKTAAKEKQGQDTEAAEQTKTDALAKIKEQVEAKTKEKEQYETTLKEIQDSLKSARDAVATLPGANQKLKDQIEQAEKMRAMYNKPAKTETTEA